MATLKVKRKHQIIAAKQKLKTKVSVSFSHMIMLNSCILAHQFVVNNIWRFWIDRKHIYAPCILQAKIQPSELFCAVAVNIYLPLIAFANVGR